LELVALVVAALGLITLHADRGFVSLNVSAFEQIALKDSGHGKQQLARGHDGRIEGAPRKLNLAISLQIGCLPVEGQMGEVFLDEHIDDHRVGEFALFHDLGASGRSSGDSSLRAFAAGQLLTLENSHEVAGRFHVEDFLFFVADTAALFSAAYAEPFLALHGDDFLAPWQMIGQGVAPGMLALNESLAPGGDCGFLLDFLRVDSGFEFEEFNLLLAQLLALGTILFEPLQPKHFP
jgi:hypothetical protein